jgi:carbonyl reductase 1
MEGGSQSAENTHRILVTGSNKGIGFATLERLINQHETPSTKLELIMTSRDLDKGNTSIAKLQQLAQLKPESTRPVLKLMHLDLNNQNSMVSFVDNCPVLSTLINNSGIMFPGRHVNDNIILQTLSTNYYNTRKLTELLLKAGKISIGGRIIFISSKLGDPTRVSMKHLEMGKLLDKFTKEPPGTFLLQDLDTIADRYESEVKDTKLRLMWPNSVYAVSKILITLFAHVLAHQPDIQDNRILVFACCPGWCRTDLTNGSNAPLTAYEGSVTPVYLTTEAEAKLQPGGFYFENAVHDFMTKPH